NGKIQAGWLLEHCGALGARQGGIRIAPFHANLFINEGGTSADFLALALKFWHKVYENFGIKLEPEVQLLGFDKNPFS
ncbi:MAG: UDP-N-acetylenolpyruvoylglucosamine reductase, partial [Candidatus Paceibacteria bacterium]